MTGLRFSRRVGEQVPDATYAGAIYRFERRTSIVDRLCWLASFALIAWALSLAF